MAGKEVHTVPNPDGSGSVKKIALTLLLLLSTLALAKKNPIPADYTINVHVSSAHLVTGYTAQVLTVIIDGKKYELEGYAGAKFYRFVLELGDYKAKLVRDDHHGTYESYRIYEFLFPDQTTRQFTVVRQTE